MATKQVFTSSHFDTDGNPAGGHAEGVGFSIDWQNGPLAVDGERKEPNGAFVETILEVVLDRLRYYQESKFASRENALTITKIEEAIHWQNHRTAAREARGVEGTHTV